LAPGSALREGCAQASPGPGAEAKVQAHSGRTRRRGSGGATGRAKTGAPARKERTRGRARRRVGAQGRQYTGRARARSRAGGAECGRKAVRREKDKVTRGWGGGGAAQLPAEEINAHGNLQQEVARVAGQRRLQSREQSGARGGRERGFSQGLVCTTEETQGPYGKLIFFPSIQRSNEKMPKTKVVELFKPYNIVLGLKLKNSKLTTLHVEF
jgi:hypothetical protein